MEQKLATVQDPYEKCPEKRPKDPEPRKNDEEQEDFSDSAELQSEPKK